MPFRSENVPVIALLIEPHLDCADARNAIRRFRDGCRTWRLRRGGMSANRALTPGDTFAWAFACLAAFNRIRLMLYAGSRRRPAIVTRCNFLQRMLNHPRLDHVCAPAARHAWEHFDERLDSIVSGPRPKRYTHETISHSPPDADTLVFRRVDPVNLTIHVLDQVIPIAPR